MQPDWQANFFRDIALDFWRRAVSPEQTRVEVDFIEQQLRLEPGARLLDVPCGNGRHSVQLAARGYAVTGVDSSAEFVSEARGSSATVEWVLGDMRELPWAGAFDGVYCCGNSFGYLNSEEARAFLKGIVRVLKPGGRFLMDTGMAAESILPQLGKGLWHRIGDIIVISENRYHPEESRLDIDYTFIRNGKQETRPSTSYCFTIGELCRMHREAGLKVSGLFDWYSAKPFQLGSRGLVIVSETCGNRIVLDKDGREELMAKATKSTHGVGTDQGGGSKAPRKEPGAGGRGANKESATKGAKPPSSKR